MQTTLLATALALTGFAANSVLCRLALESRSIDPSSFTVIRLFAGALTLALIQGARAGRKEVWGGGRWTAALLLFIYAATFSFAYVSLTTGTGALVLFGSVQVTMIAAGMLMGQRLQALEWGGLFCAFGGFVVLVLPGVTAPPWTGLVLMTTAGGAWGLYTLMGRISRAPLADTTGNFVKALPFAAGLLLAGLPRADLSPPGILLAIVSGAVATGLVYVVWYVALAGLRNVQAAVVQLAVPVIAAAGGILFVNEAITTRLVVATFMILGGILTVILGRSGSASGNRLR